MKGIAPIRRIGAELWTLVTARQMAVVAQVIRLPALAACTVTSGISRRPAERVATLETHALPDNRLDETPGPGQVPTE